MFESEILNLCAREIPPRAGKSVCVRDDASTLELMTDRADK